MMDTDYSSGLENPLYSELKYFCRKIKEAYNELKEDLTPYRDDRFYRLAPMRLYTLSKRHFVLVFVVFLICFGLTVFIGLAGPEIIAEQEHNGDQLVAKNVSVKTGPFNLVSPPLTTYNQQLWLTLVIQTGNNNMKDFKQPFEINVDLKGVRQDASVIRIKTVERKMRTLHCGAICDEIIVLHLGYMNYTQYQVTVSFKDLENVSYEIKVKFVWKTYNPTFSQVEIWFRFVFVVLTFMVTCMFAHSLRKFSMRDWGIEQKWMSVLLPLLLLYNDPFFPLSFLVNSWFPGTLDAFFQALFLCALLLFWLCVYHGIRVQGERKFLTFYLPKLVIVGLLWLSAVTLGIWQTVNELQDPTFSINLDIANFQGMKVFFLIVVAFYILYLIFLLVRACSELKNMPYSDLRLKFLTALTFVVLVISMVILYLRFGAKALQDNFVAELSTHYHNSAEFLSFYGLLNFYLYTLAFVYSPSKNALYDSQLKDNPAFSMVNDSDDEVIYGSDYEDLPLQNGRANKLTTKYQDDSDSD
ncbi:transmembrane protein 181 isoform X1 [Cyprinodon tularosa]|uniref:transmembrane protein 181 isoform X1 n=1 Tax=Cyprinodon tularosa TaxID=77115 RepID=UPI0018E23E6E|nr:transmembrane protein 181 isoform X1 [Cyprinodon tularosa]